jgi:hypothetical protein
MTRYTLSTIASHNGKNRLVGYPTSLQFTSDKTGANLILDAESEARAQGLIIDKGQSFILAPGGGIVWPINGAEALGVKPD